MKYSFKAVIYKVAVNAVVEVPTRISSKMQPTRGYIPVKGTINGHAFQQTLCPVKNAPYRLYVNIPMLKGGKTAVGDQASFSIEYDEQPPKDTLTMPEALEKRLKKEKLLAPFSQLIPSAQKEVFRYLHYLKTEESRERNINKVVMALKNKQRP